MQQKAPDRETGQGLFFLSCVPEKGRDALDESIDNDKNDKNNFILAW